MDWFYFVLIIYCSAEKYFSSSSQKRHLSMSNKKHFKNLDPSLEWYMYMYMYT